MTDDTSDTDRRKHGIVGGTDTTDDVTAALETDEDDTDE